MLKRKEKKSKPQREGYKLHERLLSGVLAAATALSFVPVREVKAEEIAQIDSSVTPEIAQIDSSVTPEIAQIDSSVTPNYFSMPNQINLLSSYSPGDNSYVSTLTGNPHYIYKAQFSGSMGAAEGLCAHAGETLNTGNPWTLDDGSVNGVIFDVANWPLWVNMMDYYWGFLANQEEIQAICNLTGENPITDYGYGTTKGDARYELGLWPYWSPTTNGGVSFDDASQKIRSQAQAIYWWIDNMRRTATSDFDPIWNGLDVIKEHNGDKSMITNYYDYSPTSGAVSIMTSLANERIEIDSLLGYGTTFDTAFDNIQRLVYFTLIIQETSDPNKPSGSRSVYGDRYGINYGIYLPSGFSKDNDQPFLVGAYNFSVDDEVPGSWHSAVGVRKADGSGATLDGAEFGIYLDSACTIPAMTDYLKTTSGGQIIWTFTSTDTDQPADETYYIKEITAPPGYELDTNGPYPVTVSYTDSSTAATTVWANGGTAIPNTIPSDWIAAVGVKKVDSSGNSLDGAVFGLYDSSGTLVESKTTTGGQAIWTFPSDATDPPADVTYTIKEISAPSGYTLNGGSWDVTAVYYDSTVGYTIDWANSGAGIVNTKPDTPSSGLIKKDFATGEIVGPATFTFTGQAYSDIYLNNIAEGKITDKSDVLYEAEVTYDFILSDGTSPIQWHDPTAANYIAPGRYILTESMAPPGYELSDESREVIFYVRLDVDKNVLVYEGPENIEITNKKLNTVIIKKVDGSGDPLPGAVFEIYFSDVQGRNLVGTIETNSQGEIVWDGNGLGCASGVYEFIEIKAPDGYVLPTNNSATIIVNAEDYTVTEYTYTFTNYEQPDIIIYKTDGGINGLNGATFEVSIAGVSFGTFTTGTVNGVDGFIKITPDQYGTLLSGDGPWAITATEISPPDGYVMSENTADRTQTIMLYPGQESAYFSFTNLPGTSIQIYKTGSDITTGLEGAVYNVWIDGYVIYGVTTDANGYAYIDHELYGGFYNPYRDSWSIIVEEVAAPPGYLLPDDDDMRFQYGEIRAGQTLTSFVFVNDPVPGIHLYKKSTISNGDGSPIMLAGATFEVTIDGYSIAHLVTDEFGCAKISYDDVYDIYGDLLYEGFGDYLGDDQDSWSVVVEEVSPPPGYLLSDDPFWYGEFKRGQSHLDVWFENEPLPGIRIYKKSTKDDSLYLEGAVFEVTIDDYTIQNVVTDENGMFQIYYDDVLDANGNVLYEGYGKFLDISKDSWTVIVEEISAPAGYLMADDNIKYGELHKGQWHIDFIFDNEPIPEVIIYKNSKEATPLPGATYNIWIDGYEIKSQVTDKDGKIVISYEDFGDFVDLNSDSWSVIVEEVAPPAGYMLPFDDDMRIQYGELRKGQTHIDFYFINEKVPEIRIYKYDVDDNPLDGAVYKVWIDGHDISGLVTGSNNNATGTYFITYEDFRDFVDISKSSWSIVVEEISPPAGYILPLEDDMKIQYGELKGGQSHIDFVFVNEEVPEVRIYKQDREGNPLDGAVYDIWIDGYNINGVVTGSGTNAKGEFIIAYDDFKDFVNHDRDSWSIVIEEVSPPAGYMLPFNDSDKFQYGELRAGQYHIDFVFVNEEVPEIRIL